MINFKKKNLTLTIPLNLRRFRDYYFHLLLIFLCVLSIVAFVFFYFDRLGLAYNDARSHLDIGRRVVEGLKPGLAQLGSVWLPMPHILMIPTIWNDFMWHTGLSGALISMFSFVGTSVLIYFILKNLGVGLLGRTVGTLIFALNLNAVYLQSTAMTEMLLIVTSTAASYYLILWTKIGKIIDFIKSAFWVMMASLTRYDGWFLFLTEVLAVILIVISQESGIKNLKLGFKAIVQKTEGLVLLFSTLAAFGIVSWFFWNELIFKDWLYFAFGPYSAHSQQRELEAAGNLITVGNWLQSTKSYFFAVFYNIGTFTVILSAIGYIMIWLDKNLSKYIKIATIALIAPLIFNILALYLGHSVLYIQGLNGNTWFNVRYGILVLPLVAIAVGFLIDRVKNLRLVLVSLLAFVLFFSYTSADAVTVDDARVGASQKNVTEVSSWLEAHAKDKDGFILISAASHDAIIFSSGLPMSKFIHEGTGKYWDAATTNPENWARWIVMRTNDQSDLAFRLVSKTSGLANYDLVGEYPFADIYQLKDSFLPTLNTKPIFGKQK